MLLFDRKPNWILSLSISICCTSTGAMWSKKDCCPPARIWWGKHETSLVGRYSPMVAKIVSRECKTPSTFIQDWAPKNWVPDFIKKNVFFLKDFSINLGWKMRRSNQWENIGDERISGIPSGIFSHSGRVPQAVSDTAVRLLMHDH